MKKTHQENFRVEVTPDNLWGIRNEQAIRQMCEDIKRDIQRHIDNIDGVRVVSDLCETCECCGSSWTEKGTTYNGGCCDQDEKNNPNPEEID